MRQQIKLALLTLATFALAARVPVLAADSGPAPSIAIFPTAPTVQAHAEFTLDIADAPELKDFADKAIQACEEWYPKIALLLPSQGYTPPTRVHLAFKKDYRGVAATGGDNIVASVDYFKAHPDDIGALIHETVHVIQHYRGGHNPGWLVEGIADYIRWHLYEPKPQPGRLDPARVKYSDSYRRTAAFLAFVTTKYGKDIVAPLNAAMREGRYHDSLWQDLTGRTLDQLGEDWKASLRATR